MHIKELLKDRPIEQKACEKQIEDIKAALKPYVENQKDPQIARALESSIPLLEVAVEQIGEIRISGKSSKQIEKDLKSFFRIRNNALTQMSKINFV